MAAWRNSFELAIKAFDEQKGHPTHRFLLEALKRDPGNVHYLILLGWTASNPGAQLHFFEQALNLDPGNALAQDAIASLAEKTGSQQLANREVTRQRWQKAGDPAGLSSRLGPAHRHLALPAVLVKGQAVQTAAVSNPLGQAAAWVREVFMNISYSAIFYLLLIALGESLFILQKPELGLSLQGILFAAIILHAAFARHELEGKFLLSLSFAPLIRLLSLSLPLEYLPATFWYVVVGVPLFIAAVYAARLVKISRAALGLSIKNPALQGFVALSGIGLGYIEFLLLRPAPLVPRFDLTLIWIPALILFAFTGVLEEFIFRGMMQSTAIPVLGRRSIPYIAVLFSVMHIGTLSLPAVGFALLVGLFFGLIALKTNSIVGVAFSHSLINIMLYLVCPFLSLSQVV